MTEEIVDGRIDVYGVPEEHFPKVARIWSELLDVEVQPYMVPLMFIAYKLVRTVQTPEYSDNSDDIGGYLDIFRRVMGPNLVQARTVDEFLAAKKKDAEPAPAETKEPPDLRIRDLGLSPSTFNVLFKAGYRPGMTVYPLTTLSYEDLLDIPQIGPARASQILLSLETHGLRLREDGHPEERGGRE